MPDPTSEACLLGALLAGNLAPDRVPETEWPEIIVLAIEHGLGPMLHWTLKQAGCDLQTNAAWKPLVRVYYQAVMDWALKERAQLEIDTALRAAGIPAIWLKGAVLARTVYPEPSLRPMSDLDVLVPYEQREAALAVVREAGYDFYVREGIKQFKSTIPSFRPTAHHYCVRGGTGNTVKLELHFRLIGHEAMLPLEQLQWFARYQHSVSAEDGTQFLTLSPEAHLVYLAAHAVLQHDEEDLYLLRYFDLHCFVTETMLAWENVLDLAVTMAWTYALERALLHTVRYFGTAVPSNVFEELVRRRPAHEDTRRITHRPRQGLVYHWNRIRKRFEYLPPAEKLQLLVRVVFPRAAYMQRYYGIPADRPVWPYYGLWWRDQGLIAARAVWHSLARWRSS